jgi:hypothetical protein
MALLNPNQLKSGIQEILKSSRLAPETDSTLGTKLNSAGLDPDSILDQVGSIMRCAEREETRLGAAKIGLQLNGMLDKDSGINIPVVNIIIQDNEFGSINPILIPR